MKRIIFLILLTITIFINGCYHASITTGLESSNEIIEKPWALGFVFGLIPPAEIDARDKCVNGVAKVETKLSFLNQLVSGLTSGIVTPMTIIVTCAVDEKTSMNYDRQNFQTIDISPDASSSDIKNVYLHAPELAVRDGNPINAKQ